MEVKLNNFYNKILSIEELKEYIIEKKSWFVTPSNYTHLQRCVLKTKEYPFLNEYIVEYLKVYPEKVDEIDENGETSTPLMLAVLFINSYSTHKTIKILLKNGANVNYRTNSGLTIINLVIARFYGFGMEKTIDLLIKYGADINVKDKYGGNTITGALSNTNVDERNKILKIILPNRKSFNLNILQNRFDLKPFNHKLCDYKVLINSVKCFADTIKYF